MGFLCDRLLKFLLPRRVSTVMLSVTLLGLIFSLPRSLKILCPLPTTVMYVPVHVFSSYVFSFLESTLLELFLFLKICVFVLLFQVPHVNRTDYQLIDISEDGFVSFCFCLHFLQFITV